MGVILLRKADFESFLKGFEALKLNYIKFCYLCLRFVIKHRVKRPNLQNRYSIPLRTSQMTLPQCHNVYFFFYTNEIGHFHSARYKMFLLSFFPRTT